MAKKTIVFQGIEFRGSKPLPTSEQIQATEKAIGMPFPPDYRDFLATVNGGRPKPSGYKLPHEVEDHSWPEVGVVDASGIMPRPNKEQIAMLQAAEEVSAYTRMPLQIDIFFYIGRGSDSIKSMSVGQKLTDQANASSLLAIAFSSLELPIYMSVSTACPGAVFEFDDDINFTPGPDITLLKDIQNQRIASSFSDFLQGLFDAKPIFKPGFIPTALQRQMLGI